MPLFDFATPDRVAELVPLLGSAVLKSTVVLVVGGACAVAARGASAAARHLIWALTLGGALVPPGSGLGVHGALAVDPFASFRPMLGFFGQAVEEPFHA